MRGVLNSGHTRPAAQVIRCEGEGANMRTRAYSTWCPKVVASIGTVASTLMDRSVIVSLRRKQRGEQVERLRHRDDAIFTQLRRRCARWSADNAVSLGQADPEMPVQLDNRPADNWRPLVAIADLAAGAWPQKARAAALAQGGGDDDLEKGLLLLGDIRRVFDQTGVVSVSAEALVGSLVALPETPWAEWRRGEKPITTRGLAFLLKAYGIKTEKTSGPRLYKRELFEEAWASYLPPREGNPSATSAKALKTITFILLRVS